MNGNRLARPEELAVEMLVPCEGASVAPDRRVTIRGPFGRIGVRSLPAAHPVFVLPIEVWGPPHTRAQVRIRFERPDDPLDTDAGPPIELAFDASGICAIGATLERVALRREGVHAVTVLAGERVLARRRLVVRLVPEWEWPKDESPTSM